MPCSEIFATPCGRRIRLAFTAPLQPRCSPDMQLRQVGPLQSSVLRCCAGRPGRITRTSVTSDSRVVPQSGLFDSHRHSKSRVPGKRVTIEAPARNKRIISSDIVLHAPIETAWEVLSDYSRLADFIPNLALSRRRSHPSPGGIRLEQCGAQNILGFEFRASVTLDMFEIDKDSSVSRAINFELVESRDFREFRGAWRMQARSDGNTSLFYTVCIVPKGLVPVKAIEWRIGEDVPQNMAAVKLECERRRRAADATKRRSAMRTQQQ